MLSAPFSQRVEDCARLLGGTQLRRHDALVGRDHQYDDAAAGVEGADDRQRGIAQIDPRVETCAAAKRSCMFIWRPSMGRWRQEPRCESVQLCVDH